MFGSSRDVSAKTSTNGEADVVDKLAQVKLRVGDRSFTTTYGTLANASPFFKHLISQPTSSRDGAHFIDSDPETFKHILQYLRNRVFPIFYDRTAGHDYALYLQVMADAQRFQLSALAIWLQQKKYEGAIKVRHLVLEPAHVGNGPIVFDTSTDIQYHVDWKPRKVHVCPKGLQSHRDAPAACAKYCREAQGDKEVQFEEGFTAHYARIQAKTLVDWEVCIDNSRIEEDDGDPVWPKLPSRYKNSLNPKS